MKCIRCKNDCTYRERSNGKCPKCKGEFAFEPRTGDMFNDVAFKAAIEAVSSKYHVRWGVEHLYYEICRRTARKTAPQRGCVVAASVIVALAACAAIVHGRVGPYKELAGGLWVVAVGGALLSAALWYARNRTRIVCVDLKKFNIMWDRWNKVHGKPTGVIVRHHPQPPKPRKLESDLSDYSFDRAVICDRARTVDLLLANNFHFENNCAVLSVEGYPPGPFETIRTMLKRNPRLQVFALHDATPDGCKLAHKLATDPKWFADQVKVIDVGLRPVHAKPFNGLFTRYFLKVQPSPAITQEEAEWLSKYTLELAVIRPEQLLKRLFRAINKQFDPNDTTDFVSDSGGSYFDSDSFSSDADSSDGGADSFG